MEFHVHSPAAKLDSLHGEAKALLCCGLATQFDLSTRPDNPLPRTRMQPCRPQYPGDGTMIERITGSRRHLAVGRHLALRDRADDAAKGGVPLLVVAQRIFQNSSLEVLGHRRTAHAQNIANGTRLLRGGSAGQY